jgi:hypothetical protein
MTGEILKRKSTSAATDPGFGAIGKSKKVGVRLDAERYVKLRTYAAQHDMTGEEVIVAALDAYFPHGEQ